MKTKGLVMATVFAGAFFAGAWFLGGEELLKGTGLSTGRLFAAETAKAKAVAPGVTTNPFDRERRLIEAISLKETELALKEEELKAIEARLEAVKRDIEARFADLGRTKTDIQALLGKVDEVNSERVKKLVKIYESMPPEQAASRIEELNEEMAVMILAGMGERKAAKILASAKVAKAVRLSELLKLKKPVVN